MQKSNLQPEHAQYPEPADSDYKRYRVHNVEDGFQASTTSRVVLYFLTPKDNFLSFSSEDFPFLFQNNFDANTRRPTKLIIIKKSFSFFKTHKR